jgi:hypothetical protein
MELITKRAWNKWQPWKEMQAKIAIQDIKITIINPLAYLPKWFQIPYLIRFA